MYCYNCGRFIHTNSTLCDSCLSQVKNENYATRTRSLSALNQPFQKKKNTLSTIEKFLIVSYIVIVYVITLFRISIPVISNIYQDKLLLQGQTSYSQSDFSNLDSTKAFDSMLLDTLALAHTYNIDISQININHSEQTIMLTYDCIFEDDYQQEETIQTAKDLHEDLSHLMVSPNNLFLLIYGENYDPIIAIYCNHSNKGFGRIIISSDGDVSVSY